MAQEPILSKNTTLSQYHTPLSPSKQLMNKPNIQHMNRLGRQNNLLISMKAIKISKNQPHTKSVPYYSSDKIL